MEHLLPFLKENWDLSLALGIVLALFLLNEFYHRSRGVKQLALADFVRLMNQKKSVLIDVRSKEAFNAGHVRQACHIDSKDLNEKSQQFSKYKEKPVLLICDNGLQSSKAGVVLKNQGFNELYSLKGGLTLWKKEKYPLVQA